MGCAVGVSKFMVPVGLPAAHARHDDLVQLAQLLLCFIGAAAAQSQVFGKTDTHTPQPLVAPAGD